jgi:hypothetical protein
VVGNTIEIRDYCRALDQIARVLLTPDHTPPSKPIPEPFNYLLREPVHASRLSVEHQTLFLDAELLETAPSSRMSKNFDRGRLLTLLDLDGVLKGPVVQCPSRLPRQGEGVACLTKPFPDVGF